MMTKKTIKNAETADRSHGTVQGKHFFLTIPHFDQIEKSYQLLELKSKELFIEKFAVVLETHTNDPNKGKHLHVFVSFTKRRTISLKFFDFLGKHGKLENVRNEDAVLQYMNKENECKANFDVWQSLLANSQTFTNTVRRLMLDGWTKGDLLRKYGKIMSKKSWSTALNFGLECLKAEDAHNMKPTVRMRHITREIIEKRLSPEELATFDSDQQFAIFVDYVNKMIRYGNQQLHKQCCIAIIGAPSIGKTTVVNELKKFFYTYIFPTDGWHTDYENGRYEMVLWNEWDIKLLSKSDLLLFTEGEIVDLKIKHSKAVKRDRPMIVLVSNDSFKQQVLKRFGYDEYYHNLMLEALSVRMIELDFGSTKIWFLNKLFVATVDDI